MKFADDEHLTPLGIWLKHRLIRLINLLRPPDAEQKQIGPSAKRTAPEDKGVLDRQKYLGSRS